MLQIHELIKNERLKRRLTEDEVAGKLNITRTTYQYWEKKTPAIEKVKRVAKALGLPEDYFFGKKDELPRDQKSIQGQEQAITIDVSVLLSLLEREKELNKQLQRNLDISLTQLSVQLENNTSRICAEIRGYGKYQILKQTDFDDAEFAKAMAVVDRIYGGELRISDEQDISVRSHDKS